MSLNHKRRIFLSNTGPRQRRDRSRPSVGVLVAAVGGVITVFVTASLFVRPSEAPALMPASSHLSAGGDSLAVLDGETLRLGEQVVRLEGIAAPPRGSICHGGAAADVDCGSAATNALASLVRGRGVACTIHGHDDHGRPVGNCLVGEIPLSAALVRDGWARAETADLREPEQAARQAGRGIWQTGL